MEARDLNKRSKIEVQPSRCYILAGDISGSMDSTDSACGGTTRFKYMLEVFKDFIKKATEYDEHGEVDVILFSTGLKVFEEVTVNDIDETLSQVSCEGWTNMHKAIEKAYQMHMNEKKEMKEKGQIHPGTILFIFTDGEPTHRVAVQSIIVDIANHIEREDEFNITILTVGSRSRELQQWLDNLHDSVEDKLVQDFDIVHVERLEDVDFLQAVNTVNHD